MMDLINLAYTYDASAEHFALLCRLVIDGRPNCFIAEDHVAVLNADGVPWMMVGKETPHGTLFEFID